MTKRTVISYLYRADSFGNEMVQMPNFDFRIHEKVDVTSHEQIAKRVYSDRGEIPSDCYLDWY
jgi:hypothetical protein